MSGSFSSDMVESRFRGRQGEHQAELLLVDWENRHVMVQTMTPKSTLPNTSQIVQLPKAKEILSLAGLFAWMKEWHENFGSPEVTKRDYVWYRGDEDDSHEASPSIYRPEIDKVLKKKTETERMHFESELLHQFRTTGGHLLHQAKDEVGLYLLARHHGLPSRLLDWSTDPLTALFFAAADPDKDGLNGHILIMDAQRVARDSVTRKLNTVTSKKMARPTHVHSVRMPYVKAAIERMFWQKRSLKPFTVIPIRPDNQDGRIFQQSSCFTFHMENCPVVKNDTLRRAVIPKGAKQILRDELSRVNVNSFSVYYDLDHLVKHIRTKWKIEKPK